MTTILDAGVSMARRGARRRGGAVLVLVGLLLSLAVPARAEGVLAVGVTDNIGRDGFVIGYSVNKATHDEARERAMTSCRTARVPNADAAKKACKVVEEFSNKCVAIADDPKDGTTGFGWAVAPSRAEAVTQAVEKCRKASSPARAGFCRMAHASCDGTAQ